MFAVVYGKLPSTPQVATDTAHLKPLVATQMYGNISTERVPARVATIADINHRALGLDSRSWTYQGNERFVPRDMIRIRASRVH